jgi:hypothetical protein
MCTHATIYVSAYLLLLHHDRHLDLKFCLEGFDFVLEAVYVLIRLDNLCGSATYLVLELAVRAYTSSLRQHTH